MLCDPVFSAKRVGRYWIPDSTFLELPIPDSQTQDSGSHKQKFSRFLIVQAKICSIPDCTSKNFLNSGLYKQKFSSIPDHYKQKFSRFRIVQATISWIAESEFPLISWGKWRVDLLFQSLRNGFILNRLQQWLSWVTKNGICTHGILSVSGVTRSPTRAPTTSPPWQFFLKQNRCRRQKKWFYSKNKLDSKKIL